MCKDNIKVGGITLYVEVYHCSRGHSYLCGDNTAVGTLIYRELLALGRKIDIFKLIYRYYLLAFGR